MYIYKVTNRVNGKIYIGQTVGNVRERFWSHCGKHNTPLGSDIVKYGKDNFTVETVCEAKSLEELNNLEKYYIALYRSNEPSLGYNKNAGGGNSVGYRHTEESKRKMSISRMGIFAGEKNPFYGKHHTDEVRQRLGELKRNKPLSDLHKQHLSDTSPKKRSIICVTTGEKFNSIREAAAKYDIYDTHISRVCRGKRKSCKGLKFVYDNTVPSSSNDEKV